MEAGKMTACDFSFGDPAQYTDENVALITNNLFTGRLLAAKGLLYELNFQPDSAWLCYDAALNIARHIDAQHFEYRLSPGLLLP